MRVRATRYSAPLSGVKTVTEIDLQDASNQSEADRLAESESSLIPTSSYVDAYGDDDIIDVDYVEDDGREDDVAEFRTQSTLTPPQSHDEFSRDDRVARYQKMMSGYSNAQFSVRRSDDAMLISDMDGYRRKLLA